MMKTGMLRSRDQRGLKTTFLVSSRSHSNWSWSRTQEVGGLGLKPGFPLYFGIKIQGLFKDFQGT